MSTDEDNNKKGPNFNAITVGGLLLAAGGLAYWWFTKKNEAAATVSKITKNKLVLCGAPGSGKGTQCEILRNNYGMVHLSTGDLLRVIAESGTEEGNKIKEIQSKGGLVPDHIVIDIVKKELAKDKAKEKGWILDGFPRTVAQAEALTAAGLRPDNVVALEVPDEELYKRITGRRSDPVTNKIYNIHFNPPPADVAARCIQRADDTTEVLSRRLNAFHQNMDFVLKYYRGVVPVTVLNGSRPPKDVYAELDKLLH